MLPSKCEKERLFIVAAEQRDLEKVKRYLKEGVNPNCRKIDRITALHVAAERGDIELAELLLESEGINLNAFTIHGYTPLIIASVSKQCDFVKYLLDHGADANISERFGKTAVHHAAFMDCLSIMRTLVYHKANVNLADVFYQTPLSIAVVDRHFLPMVKLLIDSGANIDLDRGDLVLHIFLEACLACSSEKHIEIIEYLLDIGVNPNTVDPYTHRNGLHYFAINSYIPLGRLLTARGTSIHHRDYYRYTPERLARQQNNTDAFDFLEDIDIRMRYQQIRTDTATSTKST